MVRQCYRKSLSSDQHSINGWIRMTGRKYYRFITDPRNQDRRFMDLGDMVLENPESICLAYRAELHRSIYLREQETAYNMVSLYCLDKGSSGSVDTSNFRPNNCIFALINCGREGTRFGQNAELYSEERKCFLIGKGFSYLTVILPAVEFRAGGE